MIPPIQSAEATQTVDATSRKRVHRSSAVAHEKVSILHSLPEGTAKCPCSEAAPFLIIKFRERCHKVGI